MKKILILMMVCLVVLLASVVMADENGESKAGRLFLFQKCDGNNCPTEPGPWQILPGSDRFGKLDYSLWGDTFKFSFQGRGLQPSTNYTLIYYPDPWPGSGLICLGSGQSTPIKSKGKGKGKLGNDGHGKGPKSGNLALHGSVETGSLPASYDKNFSPISPSGAVGAKIWLVRSEDVECTKGASNQMLNWNPGEYLFEYNLIIFEHRAAVSGDDDDDDDCDDD